MHDGCEHHYYYATPSDEFMLLGSGCLDARQVGNVNMA
jgi:hypothetical protein